MENPDYFVQELNTNDLTLINGGSWLTQNIFEDIGELFAALSNALAHDRQHGVHGHI